MEFRGLERSENPFKTNIVVNGRNRWRCMTMDDLSNETISRLFFRQIRDLTIRTVSMKN